MAKQIILPSTDAAKPRKTADTELKLMGKLWPMLAGLTAAGRRRVLSYLNDRHAEATLTAGETLEASSVGN